MELITELSAKGVIFLGKIRKVDVIIVLLMATGVFIFLSGVFIPADPKVESPFPSDIGKINLDASGRYLEPVFDAIEAEKDILFLTARNEGSTEALHMDIYYPREEGETRRPLILWIHGGAFSAGDKSEGEEICTDLAKRGYVCASVNYRLKTNPEADWLETAIHSETDITQALRFLRENSDIYGIDPYRIILSGDSAGGIIALNTAFTDRALFPDADRGGIIAVINIRGSKLCNFMDTLDPPVLTLHNLKDPVVPYTWSIHLTRTLDEAGIENDFVTLSGHHFKDQYQTVLTSVSCFINNRLQTLNGSPFLYSEKTIVMDSEESESILLTRSQKDTLFTGTIQITAPEGCVISGDTNVNEQEELRFSLMKPEDLIAVPGVYPATFDFFDENHAFVSRLSVPIQFISPE